MKELDLSKLLEVRSNLSIDVEPYITSYDASHADVVFYVSKDNLRNYLNAWYSNEVKWFKVWTLNDEDFKSLLDNANEEDKEFLQSLNNYTDLNILSDAIFDYAIEHKDSETISDFMSYLYDNDGYTGYTSLDSDGYVELDLSQEYDKNYKFGDFITDIIYIY